MTIFKHFKTLSFLFFLFACTVSFANPVYTGKDLSITVSKQQPIFTLQLGSNPTTGYTWQLHHFDTALLTLVDHQFVRTSDKMGAPGFETWTFEASPEAFAKPQTTTLVLDYDRHWGNQTRWFSRVYHTVDVKFE